MSTILITSPQHSQHTDPTHPEHAGRIDAVLTAIGSDTALHYHTQAALPAADMWLRAVHPQSHIDAIEHAVTAVIPGDTYVTPGTAAAARAAAGAACQAVDAMCAGDRAFALVRPPGHHATAIESMGFCHYNNVAVAARYAQQHHDLRRIAIVDIDVHHGNGTEAIFLTDPSVLYISTHGWPLYPGTGAHSSMGKGAGLGTTLNIPLAPQCGDAAYRAAYETVVIPALEHYAPDALLVSAGFDAHWDDPLGNARLSTTGYLDILQLLAAAADRICAGRWCAVLEGGYSLRALAACCHGLLRLLAGLPRLPDTLGATPSDPHRADPVIAWLSAHHPLLAHTVPRT